MFSLIPWLRHAIAVDWFGWDSVTEFAAGGGLSAACKTIEFDFVCVYKH
jgi:hypothetical protein